MEMKDKVSEILKGIEQLQKAQDKLNAVLSSGPASFYFKKLGNYIDGLFSFAKFKEGERVQLARDYDCSKAPGWAGSEHFLKEGATAVVSDIDYNERGFIYGIVFDNETWLDQKGVARPVISKHEYSFRESDLDPVRSKKPKAA